MAVEIIYDQSPRKNVAGPGGGGGGSARTPRKVTAKTEVEFLYNPGVIYSQYSQDQGPALVHL